MANLSLDIIIVPTYNVYTLAVVDTSIYPVSPPVLNTPTLRIDVPGFSSVYTGVDGVKDWKPEETNVFNSTDFGLTTGTSYLPLPDGIYYFKYTVNPAYLYYVEKTIIRVDQLQEKFDKVFMQLDMMECDMAIKKQSKVELMSIWFFIQGAIAAANNCASTQAWKLYQQASTMLDNMLNNNCGCSGNNYIINFQ